MTATTFTNAAPAGAALAGGAPAGAPLARAGLATAPTPDDLTITPRDRRFGRGMDQRRWWANGDPYATALYNALSVTFPKGEAYFVESVRNFREGTPLRLAGEIAAFIKQEVMHTREHVSFNARVADAGYDISRLEAAVEKRLTYVRTKPKIANLAATMALEHFTAILAQQLIADPRHLAGADIQAADLWRWHAMEEIEHKGVAYDTWLWATRDWGRWKRWSVKAKVMLFVTRNFTVDRTKGALDLLAQDGITGWRARGGLFRVALLSPGMFRKIFAAWASFFAPGFHPWNHDDRALIAKAESDFADARMGA